MFTLSRQTCNIYQNSNESYMLCSTLSFQQASTHVYMSHRCQVTAAFVKTVTYTSLENESYRRSRNQKMSRMFNIWKHRKCKRGKVFALFAIKKKYTASEHVEIMSVSRQCVASKQENVCFNETTIHSKILHEIKKTDSGNDHSLETNFPDSGCFHHWNTNRVAADALVI